MKKRTYKQGDWERLARKRNSKVGSGSCPKRQTTVGEDLQTLGDQFQDVFMNLCRQAADKSKAEPEPKQEFFIFREGCPLLAFGTEKEVFLAVDRLLSEGYSPTAIKLIRGSLIPWSRHAKGFLFAG